MKSLLAFAACMLSTSALAQDLAPTRATSVEVIHADAPIFLAGRRGAPRRGTLAMGSRFPLLGRVRGNGCSSRMWAQIARDTYVCDADIRYGRTAPRVVDHPSLRPGALLPYNYGFVTVDGARAFGHPQEYFTDEYIEALGVGFGVIIDRREDYDGIPFYRTRRRLYIPASSVRMARGSDFVGVVLDAARFAGEEPPEGQAEAQESLNVAWVRRRGTTVHARRGGRRVGRLGARTVVRVRTIERGWAELEPEDGEPRFVRTRALHLPQLQSPPEGAEEGTWIDVDISEQTLVAYRGAVPVYATLTSSGRRGRHHATPLGVHRLWVKLAYSDMDNLQRENVSRNYAIERVPWVQYFEGANGLHAAFWHDDFGRRKSHGCLNLAPRDARALFQFTEPALPSGWTAIFPRPDEAVTFVVVRE